jgi:hypothetical protein
VKRFSRTIFAVFALCSIALSSAHAATIVYSNAFEGSETFGSGVTGGLSGFTTTEAVPTGTPSYADTGLFSDNMLRNDSAADGTFTAEKTILTLNNLASHTMIDIDFALAIIDSWDSTDGGGGNSPDFFNVTVDGKSIFQETYANASGTVSYADPDSTLVAQGDLGFISTNAFFTNDRAYDSSIDSSFFVAHSGNTLTIEWFASGSGWQGPADESWGMDNLTVTIVPIPATVWLFGSALGLVGWLRRRRVN